MSPRKMTKVKCSRGKEARFHIKHITNILNLHQLVKINTPSNVIQQFQVMI